MPRLARGKAIFLRFARRPPLSDRVFGVFVQRTGGVRPRLPLWGNGDDRRQRRKQGGAVGAAASRMQATAKQTLGAATRAVALRSNDGEGKLLSREPPHRDKLFLCQSDAIAVSALSRQRPCPLRRFAPALPKGEPQAARLYFAVPFCEFVENARFG